MPAPFAAAFDAIEVFIRSVLPRAEVTRVGNEDLQVRNGAKTIRLPFNREQLDDFEVVLEGNQPVGYSHGLRDDLYLPIYVVLGTEGMIPDVRILEILLNQENRDWLRRGRLSAIRFADEVAKALYDGLIELQSSLRLTLESDVEVPEVRAELQIVESLTKYYEEHGNLNEVDVSLESVSYLKAAALCWIQRLQVEKARTASQRAKLAYDKKIYGIVQEFWVVQPYNRIRLPAAIHDYISQRNDAVPAQPASRPHVDIGPVLAKLDVRLRDRWRGAWAALQSDNPDRVSQAANSMVEVLDQVIDRIRGTKEFKDYLADRFPEQAEVVLATRKWISKIKDSLHRVKHHTAEQSPQVAEDLMHQVEWVVNLLLR
jgi:hypothetical protein